MLTSAGGGKDGVLVGGVDVGRDVCLFASGRREGAGGMRHVKI